ncbi:histidine utilization repressor [Sphingomonas parva]|uniref:Histidine utilization repressor n=1 Tax=Sphingomonas parva TaxID=2555898 RepID=A0A4Y8ZR18_9SPHN|nr:histidine utilization repressor [Sphingomonas parva]
MRVTAREDSPEPRYVAIKQFVVKGIASGELKPGDRLPSEAELVDQFKVSRMTASRALRELQNSGIIVRLPGVGSFVAEPAPQSQIIQIRNIADEIRSRGHEYSATVVQNASEKANRKTSPLLGVALGTPIFHSIIVHNEAGLPIQLEERFVLAAAAPEYGTRDFTQMTPNEYLTKVAPLERVDHTVRAVMPDGRARELLQMKDGEPALLNIRQTWSKSRVVSYARLTHPGSRFEFNDTFTVA